MNELEGNKNKLCPSSKCQPGSQLLGIVKEDGHVALLQQTIPIDETFVQVAAQGPKAEMRFRFANKCIKSGCKQWTGEKCGVVDQVLQHFNKAIAEATLPECSIRPQCRWYHQSGAEACKVCPFVITDITEM